MDIKKYLLDIGYDEADATTLSADPKMAKAFEASARQYEEGRTAKADAEKQSKELNEWWTRDAQPAILAADGGGAAAKAEAARYKAYVLDLKEKGYPVPEEWVKEGSTVPPVVTAPANNFDPKEFAMGQAEAMTMLYDLGTEYQDLYGAPLPNAHGLLQEAKAARSNLRDHVRSKFNFDGKRQERSEAKINERIEAARKDERDKAMADAAKNNHPFLSAPVTSRAAAVVEAQGDNKDSWKTKQGRNEARIARRAEFRPFGAKIMATTNSVN
jgi:hypothetical protein